MSSSPLYSHVISESWPDFANVPNDFMIVGYIRMTVGNEIEHIPFEIFCELILLHYPVLCNFVQIPLKVHLFRGHKRDLHGFKSLHPENLLNDSKDIYASE
eukprot:177226_1